MSSITVFFTVESSPVSSFNMTLFLPEHRNSHMISTALGGFAGYTGWYDVALLAHYGFASLSTDTGHLDVETADWALENPEGIIDWAYRAQHESVLLARTIVERYHGCPPKFSYYTGCSNGGRQGLKIV